MPDGTLIQGVPDGFTKSQLLAKYNKFQGIEPQSEQFWPEKPLAKNIFDRIGERFDKRNQALETASENPNFIGGNLGLMYNAVGQTLQKGLWDVPSEAMVSIANAIPKPVKDVGKFVYSSVANNPVVGPAVRGAATVLDQAAQGYDKFQRNHPTAGLYLDSTLGFGNAALSTLPVKGESIPSRAVGAGQDLAQKSKALVPTSKALTREEQTAALRKSASNLYQKSAAEDIQLGDKDISKLATSLNSLAPKTDLERRTWSSSNAAKQAQDIIESINTEVPSFNGLLAKRSELNSQIKVATRTGNDAEAYRLNRVKDSLDEAMMNSDSGTWQLANHQWAQQAVLDDIDEIVNKALTRAQPANSLDTALNNYLGGYKSKSLSDEEWKALKEVTNNSSFDKLRKGAASGLTKYVAGAVGSTGGPVGTAAGYLMGHYGSEFLKDSAIAAKVQKLDKFRDLVAGRKPPQITRAAETTEISGPKLLAPREKMSAIPMSEQEIAISRAKMTRGKSNAVDLSGGAIKPPVSIMEKMRENLGKKRSKEFSDLVQIYKDGDMSQNKFIKDTQQKFGLTTTQARSLAKEINTYGDR